MTSVPGYKIVSEIAPGSSGPVYLVIQESLSREVALELLPAVPFATGFGERVRVLLP